MSGGLAEVTTRRLTFVSTVADAPPPEPDTTIVVLDAAWTPWEGDRPDLRSVKPYVFDVIERVDLFEEALSRLDTWAEAASLPDLLMVEGVTYWYRMRETMWRWLHERLLWRHTVRSMVADERAIEFRVPNHEEALHDVLRVLGGIAHVDLPRDPPEQIQAAGPGMTGRPAGFIRSLLGRTARSGNGAASGGPTELRRRDELLARRVGEIASETAPRIIVLTTPSTHQRVGSGEAGLLRDPNLGSVRVTLEAVNVEPIMIGMGLDHRDNDAWRAIDADHRLLPQSLMRTRWARPEDAQRVDRAAASCTEALAVARRVPLEVDGIDLAPMLTDSLAQSLDRTVAQSVHQLARIERLIVELKPRAILLTQEGNRTSWVAAGAQAGLPVFAVQHGVLYPTHPGYPNRRHPALALPSCTFVYGEFERAVLLGGAYRDDEVEVSGSPRLDLDTAVADPDATAVTRTEVRNELGVSEPSRMLVVSTVHLDFIRRSHQAHMLERLLGGPLPGIHVVFKLHPGERDQWPYRSLLEGLARRGGYEPPPVSVVRDIDLYRLLRAADAHLGLHSTVLTDAVVTHTPNLIATVEGHTDLLGYVAAGVARPVGNVSELVAAMRDPRPAEPGARRAFLDRHFQPGDAGVRIAASIERRVGTKDPRVPAGGGS